MGTLNFTILYHRTLNNKASDRIFIEIKDILRDNRFNADTLFSYENIREGIVITIQFINLEQEELYLDLLKEKQLFLGNTLMSKY